jgi:hypothetical protein
VYIYYYNIKKMAGKHRLAKLNIEVSVEWLPAAQR